MRRVTNSGRTIAEALKEAMKDDELRSLHFTLQLVTSGRGARSRSPRRSPRRDRAEANRPKGKGKNDDKKGKGKGKGKKGKGHESSDTPEFVADQQAKQSEKLTWKHNGKNICVRYNRNDCWYHHTCREPHACLRCGELGHPIFRCTKPKVPK